MNFANQIDGFLEQKIEYFWKNIPYAKHLISNDIPLNEKYYIRHRIETINRIRLTSKMDCIALSKIIDQDYELARKWGVYTIQEMNHDKMFMEDLYKHGLTRTNILSVQPLSSTKKMVDYLIEKINLLSSGLPAICYSLFVEWNADHFSKYAVDRVENQYSKEHVLGSKRHVEFDKHHDHYSIILQLTQKLSENGQQVFQLLDIIHEFFCEYFRELHEKTILHQTNRKQHLIGGKQCFHKY